MLRLAGIFVILALAQSARADYTEQHCFVSGALLYRGHELNGEYVPSGTYFNNKYVWGLYGNNYHYELVEKNITDPLTNKTSMGWTISIDSWYDYLGYNSDQILAKNLWKYASTPGEAAGDWYQYDPILNTFFLNTQLLVNCKDVFSTAEIVGIWIGSVCGFLLLGGLLFCLCRKCKNKRAQSHNTPQTASAATPNQYGSNISSCDLQKSGKTQDNESPPVYSNAVMEDEKKTPLN